MVWFVWVSLVRLMSSGLVLPASTAQLLWGNVSWRHNTARHPPQQWTTCAFWWHPHHCWGRLSVVCYCYCYCYFSSTSLSNSSYRHVPRAHLWLSNSKHITYIINPPFHGVACLDPEPMGGENLTAASSQRHHREEGRSKQSTVRRMFFAFFRALRD